MFNIHTDLRETTPGTFKAWLTMSDDQTRIKPQKLYVGQYDSPVGALQGVACIMKTLEEHDLLPNDGFTTTCAATYHASTYDMEEMTKAAYRVADRTWSWEVRMRQIAWETSRERTQRIADFTYNGDVTKVPGCQHFFEWECAADRRAYLDLLNHVWSTFARLVMDSKQTCKRHLDA